MAAIEPLFQLMEIDTSHLSRQELLILEAELFVRICEGLLDVFREKYKNYFQLMKLTKEMEESMLEANFISLIIKDILSTQEYTLEGIANYTNFHEDVFIEIISGRNVCPSVEFLRRTIELHRSVRADVYRGIMKKIASEKLLVA